jgi:hypothetical protein
VEIERERKREKSADFLNKLDMRRFDKWLSKGLKYVVLK